LSSGFAAADTDVQRRLVAIWTELLGVEGIGVHDDFFELGGHSLMATRVLARIDDALGTRLALRDIFDTPTIHGLAGRIAAAASPLDPAGGGEREELEF
jgi:acyl carrier protein